jgi:DNA-binding HxlR family transcriptional regulator
MNAFNYQTWKKEESEQKILNALTQGDRSFSELLVLTNLSKPILSARLKSLEKQKKIVSVAEIGTKSYLYHSEYERLTDSEKALTLIHNLSGLVVHHLDIFVKDKTISDDEYSERLDNGVAILFTLRMYSLFLAPLPEQEEWIRLVIGPEFAEKVPKLLYPENRSRLTILKNISRREQAIYRSKDVKEAATKLVNYLEEKVRQIQEPQKSR